MPTTERPETAKKPWMAQGDEKRSAVQAMFAEIAPAYDRMNRLMTASFDLRWRRFAVELLELKPGEVVLDLCCGTGDFISCSQAKGAKVIGVDFCMPMLSKAKEKGFKELALGDACLLPLRSETVDAVTVGWGIRNVPDIDLAHREIFRVLKAGGRFVSLDMAIPTHPITRAVSRLLTVKVFPWLGAKLSNAEAYRYLPESARRFETREQIKSSMEAAGFKRVFYRDLGLGNVCAHWGLKP